MSSAQTNIPRQDTPAIYVANLAAYNEGRLVGEWVQLEPGVTGDEIRERIQAMLTRTSGEEYAIHDYDNMPSELGEWPDLDAVAELAEAIHEHGYELIKAYLGIFSVEQLGEFDERYNGTFNSKEDFAIDLVDQCYDLSKMMGNLANYFDYEAFARDLFMSDYASADVDGGVAVFRAD